MKIMVNKIRKKFCCALLLPALVACGGESADIATDERDRRPNILIVLVDDMGYSDIAPFGSEIRTPTLDALAADGMTLTTFRVHMMCTPTRGMLMTGLDNHRIGLGTMTAEYTDETRDQPGYEALLYKDVPTLAERLQRAGYTTILSGKWDLGGRGDPEMRPINRGFDKAYALIEGSGSHFDNRAALEELPSVTYVEGHEEISLPDDFYSSRDYADKLIEYVDINAESGKPFFGFLSLTAPHYPLQAPDEFIDRYVGAYDAGYEPVRDKRIERQRELGIIGADMVPATRHAVWPAWEDMTPEHRALDARRMEIYAAMIEAMDYHFGRVVDHLQTIGEWDNTVVLFFSDNGPEGGNPLDWGGQPWFDWAERAHDMSLENMGRRNSYVWYGPGWGYVSAAPFRYAKGFPTEGGIRSPLIIRAPGITAPGTISHGSLTIYDLQPTILEIAGADDSDLPDTGRSMLPLLSGESDSIREPGDIFALELLGRRLLIRDNWKITWTNQPWGRGESWSLFDLESDPGENTDLADEQVELAAELASLWDRYAEENGVIPIPVYPMGIYNSFTHYEWLPPSMRRDDD